MMKGRKQKKHTHDKSLRNKNFQLQDYQYTTANPMDNFTLKSK